jgi:hypothetical protein
LYICIWSLDLRMGCLTLPFSFDATEVLNM